MSILKIASTIIIFSSSLAFSKSIELSPESISTASLKMAFERNIRLNKNNKFKFPVKIDENNKCTITTLTTSVNKDIFIGKNTEWKSQNNSALSDWEIKNYSFKLVHPSGIFLMNCDLNLSGEKLLYTSNSKVRNKKLCSKMGGKLKKSAPDGYYSQVSNGQRMIASSTDFCVKKIPRITLSKFSKAFDTLNINIDLILQTDEYSAL